MPAVGEMVDAHDLRRRHVEAAGDDSEVVAALDFVEPAPVIGCGGRRRRRCRGADRWQRLRRATGRRAARRHQHDDQRDNAS